MFKYIVHVLRQNNDKCRYIRIGDGLYIWKMLQMTYTGDNIRMMYVCLGGENMLVLVFKYLDRAIVYIGR